MPKRTETIRGNTTAKSGPTAPPPKPGVLVLFSEGTPSGNGLFFLTPQTTIGRLPNQHIYIEDANLSRHHATLYLGEDGVMRLCDENSHNGTYVNGVRVVSEVNIYHRDIIRCGSSLLMTVPAQERYKGWPDSAAEEMLIGGAAMENIRQQIALLATQDADVLIIGESGTGKDVVARLLHEKSGRGPLVPVNCAAVPESLFEAELFGFKKGAFTGAITHQKGLMPAAQGGILFLDEIGDLPPSLQPKLLRAIEQRESRPIGDRPTQIDVRFIAATNQDLMKAVQAGKFRHDLYYRLRSTTINIPPLRERPEDIVLFSLRALTREAKCLSSPFKMTTAVMERLLLHGWPGNVRELESAIRQAAQKAKIEGNTKLQLGYLDGSVLSGQAEDDDFDKLRAALTRTGGNVVEAASELKLPRWKIYNLLKERGLSAKDFR